MRPVKIHVKIFGVARLKAGIGSFDTDVATLDELMDAIPGIPRKEAKDLVVLVNGRSAGRRYRFSEGDEVALLAPAGGG